MSVFSALPVSRGPLRFRDMQVQTAVSCKVLYQRVIIILLKTDKVFYIVCINLLESHSEGTQRGLNLV